MYALVKIHEIVRSCSSDGRSSLVCVFQWHFVLTLWSLSGQLIAHTICELTDWILSCLLVYQICFKG